MLKTMKYSEIINELARVGVQDASSEAGVILEELFGATRADILLNRDKDYDSDKIVPIIEERERKIPLQYILGAWYFMGERFEVSPDCLIPRPDTEILVYEALKLVNDGGCVADLCTGSGCIGVSMLKKSEKIASATLLDISNGALEMAKRNASALGVENRCKLVLGDITKSLPDGKYDMIVSNPPYIPSEDIKGLSDEVKNEPMLALDGGRDGLDIVRALIDKAPNSIKKGGHLLIEFGYDQGNAIANIMEEKLTQGAYSSYKIIKDYGGNDRLLLARV